METNSLLTTFRRYRYIILLVGGLILLSGCAGDFTPIDGSSTGFFNEYLVYPFSLLIKSIAGYLRGSYGLRSEEHTSELQSRGHLVCRLLLEKKILIVT